MLMSLSLWSIYCFSAAVGLTSTGVNFPQSDDEDHRQGLSGKGRLGPEDGFSPALLDHSGFRSFRLEGNRLVLKAPTYPPDR